MRVAREIDHVEHGVRDRRRDVGHAHEADEVEDGGQGKCRTWFEAACRDGRGDGVGGVGCARYDGDADDEDQNDDERGVSARLRNEHRKRQVHLFIHSVWEGHGNVPKVFYRKFAWRELAFTWKCSSSRIL